MTHKVKRLVTILAVTAIALAVTNFPASAKISQRDLQALSHTGDCSSPQTAIGNCGVIYVATVRKSQTQSKAAPVWFTLGPDDDSILIQTGKDTWKAKRIGRSSHTVLVWIGTADGPAFIGTAEISHDAAIQDKILTDFRNKYWRNRVMGTGPSRKGFDSGERVAIKITPVRDLPAHFASQPGTAPPPLSLTK
jgi:hypothetical protein